MTMASSMTMTMLWGIFALGLLSAGAERPICQMSDAFAASVDMHIKDWDSQIDFALNESLNCSDFLEYVYLSRDRIRAQLDYVRGNFTAEDEAFRLQGAVGGSSAWAMSHMSQAASLLSAHIHIHGILSGATWGLCIKTKNCFFSHIYHISNDLIYLYIIYIYNSNNIFSLTF